ncbi:LytR/AlgR family response regulator transcription factor [Agaribacter marinus]|uniref:DNA-binding response regulator n=1 Tax=Agaribacter marinus TaxID=1431249 RepID=A0AA37SZY1_9ALTE|nr:response regulator [Agaribacter marinus]GLR69728.1 DNA-binding response regulator [Agaribacter marinus]
MLSVLIVDDEPLAHQVILHHLENTKDFQVVGQCYSAIEALQRLSRDTVDVIFLDINMPQLNGIEMLKVLANKPHIVIVSAYQEYALEGFELDVCDYLLKPVSRQRFEQALDKLRRINAPAKNENGEVTIVLKVDRELQKFKLSEISYFESYGNYVKVWRKTQHILVTSTLKNVVSMLPGEGFTQVHKSYVVNNQHVKRVGSEFITMESELQLRVGRTYKSKVNGII